MSGFRNGPKPTIGLIGAIGAGKTTAARAFENRNGCVINADALGHEALADDGIRRQLLDRWGPRILRDDGTLDRRTIAGIVFSNLEERSALERLVFPFIQRRAEAEILCAQNRAECGFVILDAAVLLEAGWNGICDRIVYVDAPRELRLARLSARSGWNENEVAAREAAQWPAVRKMQAADAVIANDGSHEELQRKVDAVLQEWGITIAE